MARHTSHTSFDTSDEAFDLSHIFIGREQQLDLFKIYLDRWQQHLFAAVPDQSIVTTPPSPNYLTPWYVLSSLLTTPVSNKEAQSTSPLLLPKYPPVDCAAMTEKYVHIPLTFIFS